MKIIFLLPALLLAAADAYAVYDDGGGLRSNKAPCPYASGFEAAFSDELSEKKRRRLGEKASIIVGKAAADRERSLLEGLLNEGKGCWGSCSFAAGDCDYWYASG